MRKTKHTHELAKMFRALCVESRLRIMGLLAERTLCVGALANLVGVSQGAVSQHLRVLREARLVEADRRGYFIHYHIAPGAAERCRAAMDSLFRSKEGARRCAAERRSARGRRT